MSTSSAKDRIVRNPTRAVKAGSLIIGNGNKIPVQSMCATKTQDIPATLNQIKLLQSHGADLIRIAIDSKADVEALKAIRQETDANIVIDLQESYRLAEKVAPFVQKIRYNPGHLHHHETKRSVEDKVKYLIDVAGQYSLALRIGVNFGSLDPKLKQEMIDSGKALEDAENLGALAAVQSATEHIAIMDKYNFKNFVVSLKSSDPNAVVEINQIFAAKYPEIPLHLGVTEAGMLPMGEIKTRVAFENLLAQGIGDTVRVSLTLPHARKYEEVLIGKKIIEDVYAGRFRSVPKFKQEGLNIISCPSCSRVENEAFFQLAENVREMSAYAAKENITIAVMGCRVNGPGETDDADLGLWCSPSHVNLKRGGELIGAYKYDEILGKVKAELDQLIAARSK